VTTGLSTTDSNLKNNTTYQYYVVAGSSCGPDSPASNTVTISN
jgi:hypothetical protein